MFRGSFENSIWSPAVVLAMLVALTAAPLVAAAQQPVQQPASQPGDDDLDLNKPERLEWLQDAGFGMFIHWSHDSQIGSVISHSMAGASDAYLNWFIDELPRTFNPKQWDPDEIAALAKICGMKYVKTVTRMGGTPRLGRDQNSYQLMESP